MKAQYCGSIKGTNNICIEPRGHNMGFVDIPENHTPSKYSEEYNRGRLEERLLWLEAATEIYSECKLSGEQEVLNGLLRKVKQLRDSYNDK